MTIRAGVAKVCITPPVGTWQGGYGARTRVAEGVHDDLYARALVLEDGDSGMRCAIVSADVVSMPHEITDEARQHGAKLSGIPAEQIAICCSHTHGGPLTRPMGALGSSGAVPDSDYIRVLEKALGGAVAAAARDLRPVAVRIGHGEARFNVNRRVRTPDGTVMRPNPEGVVDRDVAVIRLDPLDGTSEPGGSPNGGPEATSPVAILFRYTCHATSKGADNYLFTADYPGAAAAYVEQSYGGQTAALFLQGCTGDIRPAYLSPQGGFRSATWEDVERAGREVGAAAVSAAERALPPAAASDQERQRVAFAGTRVLLPYAPVPTDAELERLFALGRWPDGERVSDADRKWGEQIRGAAASGTLRPGADAEVQTVNIGGAWLVLFPGEVFVEIGWRARDAVVAATQADARDVTVAAYSNGNVGYVPTGAAIPEGGYEVTVTRRSGGTGYTPAAEEALVNTAGSLAASLR